MPPLQALVKQRQKSFLQKIIDERKNINDDPFMFVYTLTLAHNRRMSKYINDVLNTVNHIELSLVKLKHVIYSSTRTKYITYRGINVSLMYLMYM